MMATSAIGTLGEFIPGEDVDSYMERFEFFCKANNIAEDMKVAAFISVVGKEAYEILRHHCDPNEKRFKEIVALFKQHLGSSSPAEENEDAQGPEGEAETNNHSKDSAQPKPQGKKLSTWKKVGRKVISQIRTKKQESQGLQDASDVWEHALTYEEDELKALQELGLGVAIDITSKHPWVSKSAFQAKPVKKTELIVINESNKSHRSREQVETYTAIQQGLESSFRPDPTTPINVTVAADFHRSNTRSKTINSETILTRTVAFHAKDPRSRDKISKEEFEKSLHEWLVKKKCYPVMCGAEGHAKSYEHGLYSETTNHHCIDYLKELGGVTHYVSSITLGATKYQVTSNSTLFNSISTSTEVSAHTFALASTKSKVSRKVFQSHSKEQHIGKLPGTGNILQFRTKGEAVVKCSYNSLANLVSHPQLRKLLEMGINEYIDLKKNGTRGPYHIATAELFPSKKSEERRLYWMINWNPPSHEKETQEHQEHLDNQEHQKQVEDSCACTRSNRYEIICTSDDKKASNFYLKPIIQCGDDKHFWIVTDPEDCDKHSSDTQETVVHKGDELLQREPQSDCVPQSIIKLQPQRYVSMHDKNLVVQLNIGQQSAKKSAFKLKNPRDDQTYPLHKSQWLPEALRGSQPYLIGREGKPFRSGLKNNKVWSVYISDAQSGRKVVTYGKHKNGYGFFILEPGHKT